MNSTTTFLVIAAVLVAVALAFLLPPLLRNRRATIKAGRRSINIAVYRDQMREMAVDHENGLLNDDQFDLAKQDLEARLAQDAIDSDEDVQPVRRGGRVLGFTLAVLLPLTAFGLYYQLGNPAAINAVAEAQANPAGAPGQHDITKLIQQVEEKTQSDPNNAEAWAILAKTYAAVGRWPEALGAYEKAFALKPDAPAIMTGYAEALAIGNNRVLQGKPMELVLKALELDPEDIKGLELAGIANFQEKNYAKASYYFKQLLKLVPAESPYAQDIVEAQKEAKRLAEGGPAALDNLSDPAQSADKPAAAGSAISGLVDIAPALKARIKPQDVVFLFARSGKGGAPVAVIRGSAGNFPLEFELSDAMAMSPDNRLSSLKEVTLVARVSKSGEVTAAPGDLEGSLTNVKVGAKGVKLVIDTVRN
ncbi:MAG: c-type cytochrome biogenesis protein CcmI [Hydrogenophilaceae bacterium]